MTASKQATEFENIPYIFYRDVPVAIDWLARAFGFTEEMRHAIPGGMHAQMRFGGRRIMMSIAFFFSCLSFIGRHHF